MPHYMTLEIGWSLKIRLGYNFCFLPDIQRLFITTILFNLLLLVFILISKVIHQSLSLDKGILKTTIIFFRSELIYECKIIPIFKTLKL